MVTTQRTPDRWIMNIRPATRRTVSRVRRTIDEAIDEMGWHEELERLERIIMELLANAVNAADHVELTLEVKDDTLTVIVADGDAYSVIAFPDPRELRRQLDRIGSLDLSELDVSELEALFDDHHRGLPMVVMSASFWGAAYGHTVNGQPVKHVYAGIRRSGTK